MPKIYCPHCGQGNEHSGVKPKFCGHCGDGLELDVTAASASQPSALPSQTVAARKKIAGRRPIRRFIDEEDDDRDGGTLYESDGTLPDLKKIEVEIEIPEIQREKVGDVWGTGAVGSIRDTPKRVNKKKTLNDLTERIFKKTRIDL